MQFFFIFLNLVRLSPVTENAFSQPPNFNDLVELGFQYCHAENSKTLSTYSVKLTGFDLKQ